MINKFQLMNRFPLVPSAEMPNRTVIMLANIMQVSFLGDTWQIQFCIVCLQVRAS
jgi:hypothetical protein